MHRYAMTRETEDIVIERLDTLEMYQSMADEPDRQNVEEKVTILCAIMRHWQSGPFGPRMARELLVALCEFLAKPGVITGGEER